MKIMMMLVLWCGMAFGQTLEKKIAWYEANKLDKANALAMSLFCPGAGLFYSGDQTGGLISLCANVFFTVEFVSASKSRDSNAADLFGILMIIGRAFDIGYALHGVDVYNGDLRASIGLVSLGPNGNLQPTVTLSLRF